MGVNSVTVTRRVPLCLFLASYVNLATAFVHENQPVPLKARIYRIRHPWLMVKRARAFRLPTGLSAFFSIDCMVNMRYAWWIYRKIAILLTRTRLGLLQNLPIKFTLHTHIHIVQEFKNILWLICFNVTQMPWLAAGSKSKRFLIDIPFEAINFLNISRIQMLFILYTMQRTFDKLYGNFGNIYMPNRK